MATDSEIAWAAGLFEGEGSCYGTVRSDRYNTRRIRMNLRMTDQDVVERFAKVVGVGSVYGPIQHVRASDGVRLKDVYEWGTGSWHVVVDLYACSSRGCAHDGVDNLNTRFRQQNRSRRFGAHTNLVPDKISTTSNVPK
jgi:hypothetical protein